MERLWAPWRMAYILSGEERSDECIFCVFPARDQHRDDLVLHVEEHAFVMLNKFPYNNGHLMVIPRAHVAEPGDLEAGEQAEMWALLDRSLRALSAVMSPHGFNVGMNLGRVAGAGVEGHLHLHVVPRWNGDTNFMPVLADVRVMPEHVARTAEKLRAAWPAE